MSRLACTLHIYAENISLVKASHIWIKVKVKFSSTRYRALGPELIAVYRRSARRWLLSHPLGSRLPVLSARPVVTSVTFTRWRQPYTVAHSDSSSLLIYRPLKDERLSWPGWLTSSGWFTHNSGHPSAESRAWDKKSSPARDRRSTTVQRNQPSYLNRWYIYCQNKKHLKNVGLIRHCEPPHALILHCHSPGVATVARRLRIDVYDNDNDNNDNAWQSGPLWPHGMGPINTC